MKILTPGQQIYLFQKKNQTKYLIIFVIILYLYEKIYFVILHLEYLNYLKNGVVE